MALKRFAVHALEQMRYCHLLFLFIVRTLVDRSPRQDRGQTSVCKAVDSDDAGPSGFAKGTKVRLFGLKSATAAPWNGLIAVVHCFDNSAQRYVAARVSIDVRI